MTAQMHAVAFSEPGGPEVLHPVLLSRPEPGPGEVRVRVCAATVNPTDTVRRSGGRAAEVLAVPGPYVVGMEFAGELHALGPGVASGLKVGDPVMGMVIPSGPNGGYAEYVVVPAESVVAAPRGVDLVAAATVPMNGLSAQMSLDLIDLSPGQVLAVTGAAGTYGGYVTQIAKDRGLHVVADAAEKDRQLVTSRGADVVVERGPGVAERIRHAFPEGVDGLVDGAVLNDAVVPAIKAGGRIVTVRFFKGESERDVTYHLLKVRDYAREHTKLDELRDLVERGRLTTRVAATFPFEQAAVAHRRLEAGGVRGRLVLTFKHRPDDR
ncbi:NADP-dependent oxidoreductase [uncultured Serinicoccus sp.]|uniref:NADP-dependent oxidoreductase n=1 Tax=uncultured Serinicoccus sp. TaxID=735514 RepID=UPI00342A59A3